MNSRKLPVDPTSCGDKKGIEYEIIPINPQASFYIAEARTKSLGYYWHYHPEIELGLVLQGHGTRIVGDSLEYFEDGDLCLLGANLAHCWVSDKTQRTSTRTVVIQFLLNFLGDNFFSTPELCSIRQLLVRARRGLRVEGATRTAVTAKIVALLRMPTGHWQRIPHLLWLLGMLAESNECVPLATDRPEAETDRKDRKKINQVLELTNVPPGQLPSQRFVAESVRLSPAAFSRFFRHHLGKTYVDYVIDLRIAHVCRSLIETEVGITEIAFMAGFESLSNFNRQFRKRKGLSPQNWRHQVLQLQKQMIITGA